MFDFTRQKKQTL